MAVLKHPIADGENGIGFAHQVIIATAGRSVAMFDGNTADPTAFTEAVGAVRDTFALEVGQFGGPLGAPDPVMISRWPSPRWRWALRWCTAAVPVSIGATCP